MIHSAFTPQLSTLVWLAAASTCLCARVDFGAERLLEDEEIAKSANILNASEPLFSPDGKKIAFVRPVLDRAAFNMRGEPTYRHDLWVRDLSDMCEIRALSKYCSSNSPTPTSCTWIIPATFK
jgi:hypothetical protein